MKAIMVMFDSLNRHYLPPYGCDWVHAPNFARLAERSVTFDNYYVGSMPCMPARRELHTGRYNFLHRSWGPIEPYDNSMPEVLKRQGVFTHLISDHYHYWEDGGATYHNRYSSWELCRGQEGDAWKCEVRDPKIPPDALGRKNHLWRQDWVNRQHIHDEADFPQAKVFDTAMSFLEANCSEDNWLLQVETFDPHEPFFVPQKYRDLYPDEYDGPHFDWPPYRQVEETEAQVKHVQYEYAALVSMCDAYLGEILDFMDRKELWDDTMLIVNTDHGFLLGEHGWWAKNNPPFYNEIARIPMFIWDPRSRQAGKRASSLVQMIDLPPTLYSFFGVDAPDNMQGFDLQAAITNNESVRETCLFGLHGGHVNITDGRYVYMRSPIASGNQPLYNYTLMPTHINKFFSLDELQSCTLTGPLSFSKGCKVLKVLELGPPIESVQQEMPSLLFDIQADPAQQSPLNDPEIEHQMSQKLIQQMRESDAPIEQYDRLGLSSAE